MLVKESFDNFVVQLHDSICKGLEREDGGASFQEDKWERDGGGGGVTRIITNGAVFEKAGVARSMVHGQLTEAIARQLKVKGRFFSASGVSLVLHPKSPRVPTAHANFRYFELYDNEHRVVDQWFGGGADLTPYYFEEEDASHFHRAFKEACDAFDPTYYKIFKKQCDDYFVNHHREQERRGIGGIFYDYLRPDESKSVEDLFHFSEACGAAFLKAYLPIVARRKNDPYTQEQLTWQEIRRGRYVEFNLLHDKGTLFGLKSNGRTKSILMSLPPRVRFDYNDDPQEGTPEYELQQVLLHPKEYC